MEDGLSEGSLAARAPVHGAKRWFTASLRYPLAAVFGVFLPVLAVGLLFALALPQPPIKDDAAEYHQLATSLAQGYGFVYGPGQPPTAFRPPLYPVFLALLFTVFGTAPTVVYVAQAMLYALTAASTVVLARLVVPLPAAIAAGLVVGFYAGLAGWIGFLYLEVLLVFLVTVATLATLLLAQRPSLLGAALVGALWGLAALCKAVTLVLPVLFVLLLRLVWRDRRAWASRAGLMLSACVLVLLPWTLRNYQVFGTVVPVSTNGGFNLFIASFDPFTFDRDDPRHQAVRVEAAAQSLNETGLDKLYFRAGLDWVVAHPDGFAARIARNILNQWEDPSEAWVMYRKPTARWNGTWEVLAFRLFHLTLVLLGIFGFLVALFTRHLLALGLAVTPVGITLVYAPSFVQERFLLPAIPMIAVAAVYFLGAVGDRLPWPEARWRALGTSAATAALVIGGALTFGATYDPRITLESPYFSAGNMEYSWSLVNPEQTASATKAHFARLSLGSGDQLLLMDSDWNVYQEVSADTLQPDGWSTAVPGGLIIVQLRTGPQGMGWGFKIDGLATGSAREVASRSGDFRALHATAHLEGSLARVALHYAGPPFSDSTMGVDIYAAKASGRGHYGWWAVPLTEAGGAASLTLDLAAQQGSFVTRTGQQLAGGSETWPSGDGRYEARAQLKLGTHYVSSLLFQFTVAGKTIKDFQAFPVHRVIDTRQLHP